jgi:hypothetical protein
MIETVANNVHSRQEALREWYKYAHGEALIIERAKTTGGVQSDPFLGTALPGSKAYGAQWPFGIHFAVGGFHDAPNLLCRCKYHDAPVCRN